MSKGVSETFEENEQDTAKRGVPRELVERATRTTKMKSVDLEELVRTQSGTRPAVTASDIENHVRSHIESGLVEPDPHSRPTIEAVAFHKTHVHEPAAIERTLPVVASVASASHETPSEINAPSVVSPSSRAHVSIPRWVLTMMIVGTMILIAAAGAFGFMAGRFTLYR